MTPEELKARIEATRAERERLLALGASLTGVLRVQIAGLRAMEIAARALQASSVDDDRH